MPAYRRDGTLVLTEGEIRKAGTFPDHPMSWTSSAAWWGVSRTGRVIRTGKRFTRSEQCRFSGASKPRKPYWG